MPEPGWYDDPLNPGGLRWWDGQAWSDAHQPPQPQATFDAGPPPFAPPTPGVPGMAPGSPGPYAVSRRPGDLGDIGAWFGRSLRAIGTLIVPLLILFVGVPLVTTVVGYLVVHGTLADITFTDDSVTGFGVADGLVLLALGLAALVTWIVSTLAGTHQLYHHHRLTAPAAPAVDGYDGGLDRIDRSTPMPSIGESLRVGLLRLPRYLGTYLVVGLGAMAVVLVGVIPIVAIGFAAGDQGAGLAVLLAFVFIAVMIVFFIWFWVKFAFLGVAVVAEPMSRSALKATWSFSRGRFFPVFGRLFLAGLLAWVVSFAGQIVAQVGFTGVVFNTWTFDANGELLVDGRPIDALESVTLGDLLPNPVAAAIVFGLYIAVSAVSSAVTNSLSSALYVDGEANPVP